MITNMLRRIEDLLVQVVRVVLLVFSLLVLVGMALWTWESFRPGKAEAPQAVAQELNWKDARPDLQFVVDETDRKSTRLNSSHLVISYAVFCLKKKKATRNPPAHIYPGSAITQYWREPSSHASTEQP